jgi:hypothetical protein
MYDAIDGHQGIKDEIFAALEDLFQMSPHENGPTTSVQAHH